MKYQTYLLFGAPGSGKGTQGRTLGSIPRFFHCACGDVFRSIDTRTKGRAFLVFEQGHSSRMISPERGKRDRCCETPPSSPHRYARLDGIPRNVGQAKIMDDLIDVQKVFHLSCPNRDALFARLKKRALKDNRLDDANEEVIQRRLALYETESKPVLGYYGPERITCIDATEPPAKVLLHILESVNDGVNGSHEPAAV